LNEKSVSLELQGNTKRVYWTMLQTSGAVGPRDIQRKLNFSSPNLAVYHLDKLVELGLAEKELGEYHLTKTVDVTLFRQFSRIGNIIFPRQILYASMWTTLLVFYTLEFREVSFYSLFALIFGFLGAVILWFETWKTWQSRPS